MKQEVLEEKWLKFRRFYFMEGSIDMFTCDSADDPNRDQKSQIHVNSTSMWFRLNGEGKWVNAGHLRRLLEDIYNYGDRFSANDLWYNSMLNSILRVIPESKEYCSKLLDEHGSAESVLEWWAINKQGK